MDDILRSRLLAEAGFRHGFSLRGFGEGNLSYAAMAEKVGYPADRLYEVDQVHGARVKLIKPGDSPAEIRRSPADAMVAGEPPAALGVRVADCLALLLADPDTGAVAAIHAGWRGVVAGVVSAGCRALVSQTGARPERIRAAIFPHIRRCCFEVGPEVAEQLAAISPDPGAIHASGGRPRVDLQAIVRAQLLGCELRDDHIDDLGGCTRCDGSRYYSHRREGAGCGRHLAVIAVR